MIDFATWLSANTPVGIAYNRADMERGWDGAMDQFERTELYEMKSRALDGFVLDWGPWHSIPARIALAILEDRILGMEQWEVQIRRIYTMHLK